MNFYGLIHIDRARNLDANIKWAFDDPVAIYVACASLLAQSAKAQGVPFALLTNDPSEVARIISTRKLAPFPILEFAGSREVPKVKNFYSAHFKIDVIEALATGQYGDPVGLIDVDTVFLRPPPADLTAATATAIAAYDVSSDVFPLHWDQRIKGDLELVAAAPIPSPKWYGGEFLAASAANLRILSNEIEACWPRYVDNIKSLHHVGDEMAVSAALNVLAERGHHVMDMGTRRDVVRWWSGRTKYRQPPFVELEDRMLLHLPSDKKFLAKQARHPYTCASFLKAYKAYARRKIAFKRPFNPIDAWILASVDATGQRT